MYGQHSYWRQCGLCVQGNTTEHRRTEQICFATWHEAVAEGYLQLLEGIWLRAGEVQLNGREIKSKMDQRKDGERVWHMTVAGGHIEVLGKLWDWAKECK